MDNIPILNFKKPNELSDIDESVSKSESDLYQIIKFKDQIIDTLKETNINLTNNVFNFSDKITTINNSVNTVLSKISTDKDICSIMNKNKLLLNQVNDSKDNIRNLTKQLEFNVSELKKIKHTYTGLNKLYINNLKYNSSFKSDIQNLNEKITHLETNETEFKKLRDSLKCRICYTNNINCLIQPCGHLTSCRKCIDHMRDISLDEDIKCPMCNTIIVNYKNIYLPI
jgi:DNA repair ATPase RecN